MNNCGTTSGNRPVAQRQPHQRATSTDTTIKPAARSTTANSNGQPRPTPTQAVLSRPAQNPNNGPTNATARIASDIRKRPVFAHTPIPTNHLSHLANAFNDAFELAIPFAFIRGLALRYLGAQRATHEIEIVVAGPIVRAMKRLAESESGSFGSWVDPTGTRVVYYRGLDGVNYKVKMWSPQAVRIPFSEVLARSEGPLGLVRKVGEYQAPVLKPTLSLDASCDLWMVYHWQEGEEGKQRETGNIGFLLGYMVAKKVVVSEKEMGRVEHIMDGEFREELDKFDPKGKAKRNEMFAKVGLEKK